MSLLGWLKRKEKIVLFEEWKAYGPREVIVSPSGMRFVRFGFDSIVVLPDGKTSIEAVTWRPW